MSITPGQKLGRYRVIERIGQGGMGVVFLARDTHLERDVAIKVLPPGLIGDDTVRRRFRREALALSQLSHPNIGTIYDFDRQSGADLMIMEYVPGTTLRERIGPDPLPEDEIARLGIELSEGLFAAHEKGLVHRDIKPSNLMITPDEHLKILDFGLVRLLRPLRDSVSTDSLSRGVVGTPCYMAPEQILDGAIDGRADIYSAGCVLYEMATGTRPFTETDPAALAYSIVQIRPQPINRRNPKFSPALASVIHRALEKKPARRYQTAKEMAAALETLSATTPVSVTLPRSLSGWRGWLAAALLGLAPLAIAAWCVMPRPEPSPPAKVETRVRIGVLLPQQNVTDAGEDWPNLIQTLLAEGLTGADRIAVVDPFSLNGVISGALGTPEPPRDAPLYAVLRDERIDLVADGSITAAGNSHRIVLNLIDPASGEVRFTCSTEVGDEAEIPARARELSEKLLGFLQVEILGEEEKRDLSPWITNWNRDIEAIKAFMVASRYAHRDEAGAGRYLRRAIEIDPDFIAPRVWLISGYAQAGKMEEAKRHYQHLLSIESTASPFEQSMIAWSGAFISRDLPAQERHLEVALGYSPGNNILLLNLADVRYQMADYEAAVAAVTPMIEDRWRHPAIYSIAGKVLVMVGREQEASRVLTQALEISPVDPEVYGVMEALAIRRGDREGAKRYRELRDARVREVPEERAPTELGSVYEVLATRCRNSGQSERAEQLFALAAQERLAVDR